MTYNRNLPHVPGIHTSFPACTSFASGILHQSSQAQSLRPFSITPRPQWFGDLLSNEENVVEIDLAKQDQLSDLPPDLTLFRLTKASTLAPTLLSEWPLTIFFNVERGKGFLRDLVMAFDRNLITLLSGWTLGTPHPTRLRSTHFTTVITIVAVNEFVVDTRQVQG